MAVVLRLSAVCHVETENVSACVELAQLPSPFTPLHHLHKVGTFSKLDKNVTVPT